MRNNFKFRKNKWKVMPGCTKILQEHEKPLVHFHSNPAIALDMILCRHSEIL